MLTLPHTNLDWRYQQLQEASQAMLQLHNNYKQGEEVRRTSSVSEQHKAHLYYRVLNAISMGQPKG